MIKLTLIEISLLERVCKVSHEKLLVSVAKNAWRLESIEEVGYHCTVAKMLAACIYFEFTASITSKLYFTLIKNSSTSAQVVIKISVR